MKSVAELKTKIFADGADRAGMLEMAVKPFIQGLTTNPTLMRKAGIADYKAFAFDILREIKDKPFPSRFSRMTFPKWKGRHSRSLAGATTST
jgi:transaldolase